jgi:hypothetical protein
MLDADPSFMDSVCRGLDGDVLTVNWYWQYIYKGHPAYWFCHNAPRYREYLKRYVGLMAEADMDGLHIDGYRGTGDAIWQGGCFCKYCMAGFREYLKRTMSTAELKKLGITNIETFDYGDFLQSRGVTRDDLRTKLVASPAVLPLTQEYIGFLYKSSADLVDEVHRYAEKAIGHRLALSVNSGPEGPGSLVVAPNVDFFSGEVFHDAPSRKVSAEPILTFKLADALRKPAVCTAFGTDWAYVAEHKMRGLVRAWIAQAYAYGQFLMAATRQWAYSDEHGQSWYRPSVGDYDYLYRFIRENASLFDGYESVARVGVLYSDPAFRRWDRRAQNVCSSLALANVPFRVLIAGDDWVPYRISPEDAEGLKAVVVTKLTYLDASQQAVLDSIGDRVITWPDNGQIPKRVPREITLEGTSTVTVVPRAIPGNRSAPYVCHLLNRDYDPDTDSMRVKGAFKLILARSLFPEEVKGASIYAPGKQPVKLGVRRSASGVTITVPELDLWAILELDHTGRAR